MSDYNNDFVSVPKASEMSYGGGMKSKGDKEQKDDEEKKKAVTEKAAKSAKKSVTNAAKGIRQG